MEHAHSIRGGAAQTRRTGVVRISGTYSCLFLIKSLRCKARKLRQGAPVVDAHGAVDRRPLRLERFALDLGLGRPLHLRVEACALAVRCQQ